MDAQEPTPSRALMLAGLLEHLLLDQELRPGDRFLTAREAARHLGVRQEMANRALQILEHRGLLLRRQRVGAVVAERRVGAPAVRRVHLLVQEEHEQQGAAEAAAVEVGLHGALPGCEVEVAALAGPDVAREVEQVCRRALRGEGPEGLVLVRCGYAIQRQVADSGVPAVVHGTAFAGLALSSLDEDADEKGRLQAAALRARGCRRIVVLRRDRSLPGEVDFLRGLRSALAGLGWLADAVDQLELAPFPALVASELSLLLRDTPAGELGILATTGALADAACAAVVAAGLEPGRDVPLIANRAGPQVGARTSYPHLRARLSPEQQGAKLGALLRRAVLDPTTQPVHEVLACELITP